MDQGFWLAGGNRTYRARSPGNYHKSIRLLGPLEGYWRGIKSCWRRAKVGPAEEPAAAPLLEAHRRAFEVKALEIHLNALEARVCGAN